MHYDENENFLNYFFKTPLTNAAGCGIILSGRPHTLRPEFVQNNQFHKNLIENFVHYDEKKFPKTY